MATKKTTPPKQGRKPPKVLADQAAARRAAAKDGLPKSEAQLTPFAERFCVEYVRIGILEDAHRATELALRVPLDTTGFNVEVEKFERKVKGKTVYSQVLNITDDHGRPVSENDLRLGAAANLYSLPEVKRRIRELRADAAAEIKITAETLARKIEHIQDHAIRSGQLQVALNGVAMEAKLFGLETGPGEGAGAGVPATATSVNINIRDFSGPPAAPAQED